MDCCPLQRHGQWLESGGRRWRGRLGPGEPASSVVVTPVSKGEVQELGEREQASWRWTVTNRGTQDSRLQLDMRLVNRNSDEIEVLDREYLVASSSVVRQMRTFLQPVPISLGAVLGFVLFGIVGVFRRGRRTTAPPAQPAAAPYAGKKQL